MTTKEQDTALDPGTREVDYEDIAAGMRFMCAGHAHEILSVKAYAPGPAGKKYRRARKVLSLSPVYGCPEKEWTCEPGDAIICAAEPNTDAVDTQPIKARTPIVTHTIPACEVVPGMLLAPGWNIVDVRRDAGELLIAWRDRDVGDALHYEADEHLVIRLPGPSPRDLCCSCKDRDIVIYQGERDDTATLDPQHHAAGCPVAPVTGVHGGIRLWPAPFKGAAWRYDTDEIGWCVETERRKMRVWPEHLRKIDELRPGYRDMVLERFFLPPTAPPEPDRRIPGASPDDLDLERVADLVSGGAIGPVRR